MTRRGDVVAVLVTGLAALTTLDSVFDSREYLAVGAAGLVIGVLTGWVANWRKWMPITAVAAWLVLLVLAQAPLIAHAAPSLETLRGFADGATGGWRGLLTTTPPVQAEGPLLVVPYLGGAIAGLSGVLLAGRSRFLAAPLAGPGLLLLTGLLLGTEKPVAPMVSGIVFAVAALVATMARQNRELQLRRAIKRLAHAALIVAIAAVAATAVVIVPAFAGDRFVLREHIELPFDPSIYPSPLAAFRRYEVTQKREVLFNINGLPAESRVRLAVMDTYDGLVWKVAGSGGRQAASGVFERVGAKIPVSATGRVASVQITIRELGGVWIPTAGSLTSLRFRGLRGAELADSFRYNRITGTGVLRTPGQLRPGDTITFDAIVPAPANAAGRPAEGVTLPTLTGVPDQVEMTASDWVAGASGAYATLDALVKRMRSGAFSDGTGLSGAPSWSGHSAGRIREFLGAGQLVGDAEQYAATLALMARQLGLPARVVLGVVPPSATWTGGEVTGEMVSAWVEVHFAGAGWVPFDPTPPVTNTPHPPKPPSNVEGSTEVVYPPVIPEAPPEQRPPLKANEDLPTSAKAVCSWCRTLIAVLAVVLPPLLFVLAICLGIKALKLRRRRKRRTTGTGRQRVAGGWLELLDNMRDYRVRVPEGLTRHEVIQGLYQLPPAQLAQPLKATARGLARRADEAVFGPEEVLTSHVGFWSDVDDAVRALGKGRPLWQRIAAALNPVTLLPSGGRR